MTTLLEDVQRAATVRPSPAVRKPLQGQKALVTGANSGIGKAVAAAEALQQGRYRLVSPGVAELPDDRLGFGRGVMVRDPDGHTLLLRER